jgi:predicted membrane-bound mannosyltransferase
MAESKGQERSHPWLLADQGLRAHRREKTRRERMVAFQASYWALEAVLGYVQLMREGMAGRQGSRT